MGIVQLICCLRLGAIVHIDVVDEDQDVRQVAREVGHSPHEQGWSVGKPHRQPSITILPRGCDEAGQVPSLLIKGHLVKSRMSIEDGK